MERCDNCLPLPIGNQSSNVWRDGGPAAFPLGGVCPICGGTGMRATESSEVVSLLVSETPKKFFLNTGVVYPDGAIQTKGYARDLPKILRCEYMIKDIEASNYIIQKYRLSGEPSMPANIAQHITFVATWERIA